MNISLIVGFSLLCFLLGSIPFGVIVSKVFYKTDVRDSGSGNIGFTNSLRAMGKAGGAAVFIGDFLKGLASAAIGVYLCPMFWSGDAPFFCETAAVFFGALGALTSTLGHIFCPWLGFRGGKGISCAFGASFIAMNPIAAGCLFAAFLLVVLISKYVSAGSVTAAFLYPFAGIWAHPTSIGATVFFLIVGIVVIWAHAENLKRISGGVERKIGGSKKAPKPDSEKIGKHGKAS